MDAITVRRASSADLDAVTELYEAVADEGRWLGAEAPVEWTPARREMWTRIMDDDELGAWFLAEQDGAVAGYISIRRSREHADFEMAVDPGRRGQGIGGLLLDAVLQWCRERPISKIELQVWPHNGAAIALYRSRGFVVEGRQRRQWRRRNGELWDSVLMALVLDETSPGSNLPDAPDLAP